MGGFWDFDGGPTEEEDENYAALAKAQQAIDDARDIKEISPELQAKLDAMTPEERAAFDKQAKAAELVASTTQLQADYEANKYSPESLLNGAGDLLGDLSGASAAEAQERAAKYAVDKQIEEAERARKYAEGRSDLGIDYINSGTGQATGALGDYSRTAEGSLARGYQDAMGSLGGPDAFRRYAQGATTAIGSYDVTGQPSSLANMMSRGNALSQRLDQPTNLEDDRGYQFRRQQGEDAINRAASARGGRLSGRTLQELGEFNSGLASQEYAAADQRRMATNQQQMGLLGQQYGAAGNVDQFWQNALLNQAGRQDAASLQAQQNQMGLAGMGSGMQADYGARSSGMQQGTGQSLAELYANSGNNKSNAALGAATHSTQLAGQTMNALGGAVPYAGGAQQANSNFWQNIAGGVLGWATG